MNKVDVSIILVNYKTAALCSDVFQSIKDKTLGVSYETIIVDNSESEEEFETLKQISNDIRVFKAPKNLGFGKGNNLGASKANGDYLFFLNTDTLLINDAISILCSFLKQNEKVGIVGPNLYSADNKPNVSYELKEKYLKNENGGVFTSLYRRLFQRNYFFNHGNKPLLLKGYVSGAALMIKKECFESVGGFDEAIFMYAEESLLCFGAIRKGYQIFNVPDAKIIHLEGKSFQGVSEKKAKMFIDGNYIYYSKAFSKECADKYLEKCYKKHKKKYKIFTLLKKKDKALESFIMMNAYRNKIEEVRGGAQ